MTEEGSSSGDDADDNEDVSPQIFKPSDISLLQVTFFVAFSAGDLLET